MNEDGRASAPEVLTMGTWDVVVCGGGPAGVGAAVAAARRGVRTLLVERYTHLGGMATGARVSSFCDSPGGPLFDELLGRLAALGAVKLRVDRERFRDPGRHRYEPETLKSVLMEMAVDAGVDVMLDTFVFDAVPTGNRVTGVRVANKGGACRLSAGVVVDATADADIAAAAGVPFLKGDPEDGRVQHCNYRWALGGVDWERFRAEKPDDELLLRRVRAANQDGRLRAPSAIFGLDPAVFPWDTKSGTLSFKGWELQHVDPTDPV